MGYNAFVSCNCYQEGRTSQPPYPEYLQSDEEGPYLSLPESIYQTNQEEYFEKHLAFDQWKLKACSHEDMEYANERLANISGMAAFRKVVREMGGPKRFPILSEYLPISNGGFLPAQYAQELYRELEQLEKEPTKEQKMVLQEVSTNTVIASTNVNASAVFVYTAYNQYNFGIDQHGFFVLRNSKFLWKERASVIFRASSFQQIVQEKDSYRFINTETGKRFVSPVKLFPLESKPTQDYSFVVSCEQVTIATEYGYIMMPLKKLALASLDTGNPIVWT